MNTEIYVFFAFGILAMIINISFLTVTLLVQVGDVLLFLLCLFGKLAAATKL